jgi:mono/diheme cytochrome c family protein
MRAFKLTLASLALLYFAAACNSGGNTQNQQAANINARPAANTSASATPAPASTPDELAQAAADYKNTCVKCHKADGAGGPFDNDGREVKVPDLRTHGLKDPDKELAEQIAEGGDDMPPFKKKLDAERINNLVRYIRREFHHRTPGAPAAGGNNNAAAAPQPAH